MVHQTRRIVEDYVLYKIHTALSSNNYIQDQSQCINHGDIATLVDSFPLTQSPTKVSIAVRDIADQYDRPDLLKEIRPATISESDIDHIFRNICKELFQVPNKKLSSNEIIPLDDIKWGHIIALLVFAGRLAVRAVVCLSPKIVDSIVIWVTRFLDNELSHWFSKQGGWENFLEWSKASCSRTEYPTDSGFDPTKFSTGLSSVMGIGALALAGVTLLAYVKN